MDQKESATMAWYNATVRIAIALERIARELERTNALIDKGKCH